MRKFFLIILGLLLAGPAAAANVTINRGTSYQVMDGIGVNANSANWIGTELEPTIDALVAGGITTWRVILETEQDWAAPPSSQDYSATKFARCWGLIAYLNSKNAPFVGISLIGLLPSSLSGSVGGTGLLQAQESNWATMIADMLDYGINTMGLHIDAISPFNEPDISGEGPSVNATQLARAIRTLVDTLSARGLDSVQIITPDVSTYSNTGTYVGSLDSATKAAIQHYGAHNYSGAFSYSPPNGNFWATEFSPWIDNGEGGSGPGDYYSWSWPQAQTTWDYAVGFVKNYNVPGVQLWEAYNSTYEHGGGIGVWGGTKNEKNGF